MSASAAKSSPDSDSDEISPPKKKRKQTSKPDSDAKLAAMLQAQENSRTRSTRGGGSKKVIKKTPKKPRKKSEKKVKAEDDSEVEVGSDGEVKEKVRKGGFHKLYHLSAPLADLVGEPTVSVPFPHLPKILSFPSVLLSNEQALMKIALAPPNRQEDMGVH
jgi:chromatin remodeling complex protein RSC6